MLKERDYVCDRSVLSIDTQMVASWLLRTKVFPKMTGAASAETKTKRISSFESASASSIKNLAKLLFVATDAI